MARIPVLPVINSRAFRSIMTAHGRMRTAISDHDVRIIP